MHTAQLGGSGEAEGAGQASESQGQSLLKLEPPPSLVVSSEPRLGSEFSEYPFLQELDGVHKGEAGAGALYVKLWSPQSCTSASLAWVGP